MNSPAKRPTRRFWPRFTLRVVLVLVTVHCVGLAIWTYRARKQKVIVERMNQANIEFTYDHQRQARHRSSVPRWLLNNVGVDFFHSVEAIRVGQFDANRAESEDILRDLSILGGLKRISIESKTITDREATLLESHTRLEELTILCHEHHGMGLSLHTPPLTDSTLEMIARLPRIKLVRIEGLHFTAQGLRSLAETRSLEVLCVHHCKPDVTREDLRMFRESKRLRHLNVTRYRYGNPGFDSIVTWGEPPW
jgi:hypothetical protein